MTAGAADPRSRGVRREVAGPDGRRYLVQAAPSGFVEWSSSGVQGPVGFVVHTVSTWLLHRLAFWGGWTVLAWQSDQFARKRTRVAKSRHTDQARALEAWEDLASTIARSGPPST